MKRPLLQALLVAAVTLSAGCALPPVSDQWQNCTGVGGAARLLCTPPRSEPAPLLGGMVVEDQRDYEIIVVPCKKPYPEGDWRHKVPCQRKYYQRRSRKVVE